MMSRLCSVLAWTLGVALALAPVGEAVAQSRNSFRPIFQPGGGVSSSTNKPAVGATTATGQVPAGASASCKRNGSVTGSASVTAQGSVTCTFLSAIVAGDTFSIPWSLTGESPAAVASNAPVTAPVNSALPAISGTPQVGQTLASSTGSWSGSPTSYAYAWSVGGTQVQTGSSNAYTAVSGDVGKTVSVAVTASNTAGSATATSAATSAVTTAAPTELLATSRLNAPGWNGYYSSDGTDTNSTTRIAWVNESGATITKMKAVLGNWLINATNEQDGYNPIRAGIAVEYPAGTYTLFPFGGSTAVVTIPPSGTGNTVKSDEATLATPIPPNATAWARPYVEVDAGGKWPQGILIDTSAGEAVEFNAGDKRASGTITNVTPTATRRGFPPIALTVTGWTGTLRTKATLGAGDSLARGDGGFAPAGGGLGYMALAAAGNYPHLNWGFTGTQAANNLPANLTNRLNALSKGLGVTIGIVSYFSNDAAAGRTGPQIFSDTTSIWGAYKNARLKIAVPTGIPRVNSTTANFTLAGQTPISAAFETARASFNSSVRAKPNPIDVVIEVADAIEPSRGDGRWTNGDLLSSTHLQQSIDGAVTSGSTTTAVNTNLTALGSNDLKFGGGILFTSGALNGTFAYVTALSGGGAALTVSTTNGGSTALASAPAAGDTFKAYRLTVRLSGDGTHPIYSSTSAPGFGGQPIMGDVTRAAIQSLP